MTCRAVAVALTILLPAVGSLAQTEALPTGVSGLFADAVDQAWPTGRLPVGAGTTIAGDAFVLTAAHVIAGCRRVEVSRENGLRPAALIGLDTRLDLALLRDDTARHKASSRLADAMTTGERVGPSSGRLQVVGFGQPTHDASEAIQVTVHFSGLIQDIAAEPMMLLSGKLVPGTSGSPVLDKDGRSIGMVVGQLQTDQASGIAVRSKELLRFLAYFGLKPLSGPSMPSSGKPGRQSAQGVMVRCMD